MKGRWTERGPVLRTAGDEPENQLSRLGMRRERVKSADRRRGREYSRLPFPRGNERVSVYRAGPGRPEDEGTDFVICLPDLNIMGYPMVTGAVSNDG